MKIYNSFGIESVALIILFIILTFANGTGLKDDDSTTIQLLELDKEYQIYRKRLMWSEALNFCSKCVGGFATFDTPEEALKVAELIYAKSYYTRAYDYNKEKNEWGLDRRYWFGLTDEKKEGEWLWMKDSQPNGTLMVNVNRYRWYPGQPDHIQTKKPEHCGAFWNPVYHKDEQKPGKNATGRRELHWFNDMPCDHKLYFICKTGKPPTNAGDAACSGASSETAATESTTQVPVLITPVPATVPTTPTPMSTTATPVLTTTLTPASTTAAPKTSTEKPAHEVGEPYTEAELQESQAVSLKWHNILRAWHNAPEMTIDPALNKAAQLAAEHLVRLGRMEHFSTGENLYLAAHPAGNRRFAAVKNAEFATKEWYFELCDTENWPKGELNHYTQVVWKDSIKLGIGVATNKENSQIHVVARYDPIGNYEGEYDLGVTPIRCGTETVCNGMKAKNVTGVGDCPAGSGSKPAAAGRSMGKKTKQGHVTGKYVHPKARPTRTSGEEMDNKSLSSTIQKNETAH